MSITQLTKSDSGRYRCSLSGSSSSSFRDFEVTVTDGEFLLTLIKCCQSGAVQLFLISCHISAVPVVDVHVEHEQSF